MAKKAADNSLSYAQIKADIEAGHYAPIYILHGEESYYIDCLVSLLLQRVLTEEEKDFDLTQFFAGGSDFTIGDVVAALRRFPFVATQQLVILHEVQAWNKNQAHLDTLIAYAQHLVPSTIFVLTHKTAPLTGEAALLKAVRAAGGVVFQSDRLRDYELPSRLPAFLDSFGLKAEPKAIEMLITYIGSDLSRLATGLDKLKLTLGTRTLITAQDVADNIGVSREYNVFEFSEALALRDIGRAERIRLYFARNPKAAPMPVVVAALFTWLQNLILAFYAKDKTLSGLMKEVGCSYPQAKMLEVSMKKYSGRDALWAISCLRELDARSKGARPLSTSDPQLLQEFIYQITHRPASR